MNQEKDIQEYFLSWQGEVTGPHSFDELQRLLRAGEIHSLYKVQVHGQWMALRDHLSDMSHAKKQKDQAEKAASPPPPPLAFDEEPPATSVSNTLVEPTGTRTYQGQSPSEPFPSGLANASFYLSLFFFVPFLNAITLMLSIMFGHMAFSQEAGPENQKHKTLAWTGLWISYVQVTFILLAIIVVTLAEVPLRTVFYELHGQMLGVALLALVGSGILMLGVYLAAKVILPYKDCFVGALLPSGVTALTTLLVEVSMPGYGVAEQETLLMLGIAQLVLFIGQIFFWSKFIYLNDEECLGPSRAVLVSIFYTFILAFVGVGYAFLQFALSL